MSIPTPTVTVRDPRDITPVHEPDDPARLQQLIRSMTLHGWHGAPVVVDGGQALTGSHRIAAARRLGIDVPTVDVRDLMAGHGHDWGRLVKEWGYGHDYDWCPWFEAARRLGEYLPAEVMRHYGIGLQ